MALFKLRKKKVDEPAAAASPAESVEVMRRRARHRLIGAVVLVLAGVIGFPVLFDTQPRPVAVDIPIEIPDRNKVQPLPSQAPMAAGKVGAVPAAKPTTIITESRPDPAPVPPPVEKAESKPAPVEQVAKPEPAPEEKPEPKAESNPEPKATQSAKTQALLEAQTVDSGGRYVVQVGAFAEKDKARLAQQKLDRAGLKNYTHVAETKNGTRIRVRAGPFASRAEADKAAEKITGLDLPAAVLTL